MIGVSVASFSDQGFDADQFCVAIGIKIGNLGKTRSTDHLPGLVEIGGAVGSGVGRVALAGITTKRQHQKGRVVAGRLLMLRTGKT